MRHTRLLAFAALLMPAAAMAGGNQVCHYRLQYDVALEDSAVRLDRDGRAAVEIDGDRLWLAGREQALSASERQRVRAYGETLQRFTRDLTRVALQGAQLGLEGAALAIASITGQEPGPALTRRFDEVRSHLNQRLDGHHLSADMLGDDFDKELDTAIEGITTDALEEAGAGIGRLMMLALVAPSRLEARAERAEKLVEAHMEQRAADLERQADTLCAQVRTLDALENSLGRFDGFTLDAPSI